jgi:hypothetical protein
VAPVGPLAKCVGEGILGERKQRLAERILPVVGEPVHLTLGFVYRVLDTDRLAHGMTCNS